MILLQSIVCHPFYMTRLVAEVFFALGYRPDLRAAMEARALKLGSGN